MYTAIYKKVSDGYAAWIEEIPGVNTQGSSKREARANLEDALKEFIAARKSITKKEQAKGGSFTRERLSTA